MDYKIKDAALADEGAKKIEWARAHMPVLQRVRERFAKEKPLKGFRIGACLHVTKETAVLMETLRDGGAEAVLCGSNPLSTQDDVAAALVKEGIPVFAWRGLNDKEYYECINRVLDSEPNIVLDDGADLIGTLHSTRRAALPSVIGGQEETTTGVIRLRAIARDKALAFPIIAVNDAPTKHLFDNRFGTGQSTLDGIIRATDVLLAGKTFVIAGYGWCGRGLAMRARGMGANVVVTEVDAVKAIEAHMDGFRVMPMLEAAKIGDIFVTATGDINVITKQYFPLMKNGAILANTGHFDVEINVKELNETASSKRVIRPEVEEFTLKNGNRVYLLAQGRLVNLACASGHPSEVMDQSFSDQALCSEFLAREGKRLEKKVYDVPKEIDDKVAELALESKGLKIDSLTEEQKKYLASWQEGT